MTSPHEAGDIPSTGPAGGSGQFSWLSKLWRNLTTASGNVSRESALIAEVDRTLDDLLVKNQTHQSGMVSSLCTLLSAARGVTSPSGEVSRSRLPSTVDANRAAGPDRWSAWPKVLDNNKFEKALPVASDAAQHLLRMRTEESKLRQLKQEASTCAVWAPSLASRRSKELVKPLENGLQRLQEGVREMGNREKQNARQAELFSRKLTDLIRSWNATSATTGEGGREMTLTEQQSSNNVREHLDTSQLSAEDLFRYGSCLNVLARHLQEKDTRLSPHDYRSVTDTLLKNRSDPTKLKAMIEDLEKTLWTRESESSIAFPATVDPALRPR